MTGFLDGLNRLYRFLGSLSFAIILIAGLALLLILSTTLESVHGTPFAQRIFYRAGWFDIFLSLLGINILFSALRRIPYEKRHTGFVVTHLGILVLLAGSLLSRMLGVEGQLPLLEGERGKHLLMEGFDWVVSHPKTGLQTFEFRPNKRSSAQELQLKNSDLKLYIHKALEHAEVHVGIEDDPEGTGPNHAIQVELASQTAGFKETFWLTQKDPRNPKSHEVHLGPAIFRIARQGETRDDSEDVVLTIRKNDTGQITRHVLNDKTPESLPVFDGQLRITDLVYYPNARVHQNRLVNDPSLIEFNPAVVFVVQGDEGRREKHTRFALFPEFDSLHGQTQARIFDLSVELNVNLDKLAKHAGIPTLEFIPHADGTWSYQSASKSGALIKGAVLLNQSQRAGWMDITFQAKKLLERARIQEIIRKDPAQKSNLPAAQVSLSPFLNDDVVQWVTSESSKRFLTPIGPLDVGLSPRSHPLEFELGLNDFRKVDYPGTNRAMSFESDVTLLDLRDKTRIQTTIRMNEPLDRSGFRIFQSSYFQGPDGREGSVFTVAKNPGITLIYTGACIIFAGIVILFYIPPFSRERS